MALSNEQIVQLSLEWPAETNDWASHIDFARAIEAEVRKQDEALIRQLAEALETCDNADGYHGPYQYHDDKAVEAAITAARARLEGKP